MPARRDPAAALAEKMLQSLEAQRGLETDAEPLTLRRLAELTDPTAPAELILKAAAKKKPFGERALVVQAKNLGSPVLLLQDAAEFAGSAKFLEWLLGSLCSPAQPTCEPAKLARKVPPKLRQPFLAALDRRLAENDWPTGVAVVSVKKKKLVHVQRYPLPKPPEEVVAERLLQELCKQRDRGGDAYPTSVSQLVERSQPPVPALLIKKALGHPVFQTHIVLSIKNNLESPCALCGDESLLAGSDLLMETILDKARVRRKGAHTISELSKAVIPLLRPDVERAVRQRVDALDLPAGIGSVSYKTNVLLFRLSDVRTNRGSSSAEPASRPAVPTTGVQPVEFVRAFDAAFDQLDRQRGSHNAVSLVDLRRALAMDRQSFDAELQELRRTRRYTLSGAEGRHGITPEEREAGIYEDGSMLLYVSRRRS
jgi:hypothetical protein